MNFREVSWQYIKLEWNMGEFQEENKKAGTLFLEIKTNCYVLSLTEIQ